MTDKAIIDLYRSGQRENAFGQIVSTYSERLYWHVRRMVLDHDDANDCLQNSLIRVWNALPSFRGDSGLFTWLYRITTNECITFLSRKRSFFGGDAVREAVEKLSSDSYFDGDQLQLALHKAIAKLPPKQKAVFTLRYFDEMPYDQISKILDTSEGSLKASYHHAYEKVKNWVKAEIEEKY